MQRYHGADLSIDDRAIIRNGNDAEHLLEAPLFLKIALSIARPKLSSYYASLQGHPASFSWRRRGSSMEHPNRMPTSRLLLFTLPVKLNDFATKLRLLD